MTRHHDPEKRKQDFLNTALELFNTRGYEKTTVNDIIKAMGVSKGAFYHYFQSKEDVIEQISENYADHVLRVLGQIAHRTDLNAVEKLNVMIATIQGHKTGTKEQRSKIKKVFKEDDNLKLERKILTKLRAKMLIITKTFITEGIENKLFRSCDAHELSEFLIFALNSLDTSAEELVNTEMVKNPPDLKELRGRLVKKLDYYEEIINEVLKLSPGTVVIKEPYLNRFLG
ncbi:TetR/AcrR family transcriptional regulator [Chitinispirillales bacterium ANBcel5]|uniref:TetR/AcrR family transcriptional regulator n=1 Tax=Cellulosispirillum alkaliphilum TaxID=3039283 RepID=UPI002A5270E7|nr:TetR/AcrR family transcriptional regulator [Chitinispirillales bacterium ANBcel5]